MLLTDTWLPVPYLCVESCLSAFGGSTACLKALVKAAAGRDLEVARCASEALQQVLPPAPLLTTFLWPSLPPPPSPHARHHRFLSHRFIYSS